MKKILLLLTVIFSMLLTACGSGNGNEKAKDEKVVIKYGLWDSVQKPIFRELADQFEKENPNIKIEIEQTPYNQYWTKLQATSTGGVAPDVVWMNGPNIMKYARYDMLLPLDDMMKKDRVDLKNYVKGIGELYNYKGKQYGIPKDVDSIAMWYNKNIFDKAGISYPTNDWTWDEMKAAAINIQATVDGVYGIAIPVYENQSSYYNIIPQNEGFIISKDKRSSGFDNPKTIEALKMLKSLFDDKASADYTTMLENKADKMFQSEQIGMIYQGSWKATPYNDDDKINGHIGVVKMPKIKNASTVVHGIGYAIVKNTEHPKEAWKFIKFLTNKSSNDIIAKSGITIPAYLESQELWAPNFDHVDVSAYINSLSDNVAYPVSLNTAKWTALQDKYLPSVWTGLTTVEEASKKITDEMNEILKKEK